MIKELSLDVIQTIYQILTVQYNFQLYNEYTIIYIYIYTPGNKNIKRNLLNVILSSNRIIGIGIKVAIIGPIFGI